MFQNCGFIFYQINKNTVDTFKQLLLPLNIWVSEEGQEFLCFFTKSLLTKSVRVHTFCQKQAAQKGLKIFHFYRYAIVLFFVFNSFVCLVIIIFV